MYCDLNSNMDLSQSSANASDHVKYMANVEQLICETMEKCAASVEPR